MAHPTLYGYTVCPCIVASAPLVERRFREAGLISSTFSGLISQGCYSAGAVAASAGTHDGGGVLDLKDWTPYRADADVLFTACGWLDFYRPYGVLYAKSPAHHHVVLNGCPHLASGADAQRIDALNGLNGLAGKGKDSGPRPGLTWQQAVAQDGGAVPADITTTTEDDMIFIKSPGRQYALIGPGYSKECVGQVAIDVGSAIASKSLVNLNDAQWDMALVLATSGNLIPSVGAKPASAAIDVAALAKAVAAAVIVPAPAVPVPAVIDMAQITAAVTAALAGHVADPDLISQKVVAAISTMHLAA